MRQSCQAARSQWTRRNRYVAVAGPIASGKSTLAQLLQRHLGWQLHLEGRIHQDNPFFADAYSSYSRWGFHGQVYNLVTSAERHSHLAAQLYEPSNYDSTIIVEDRTPFDHTAGYVRAYAALDRIAQREVTLLEHLTKILEPLYVFPDLLVFRKGEPRELLSRIQSRQRPNEANISTQLIEAICNAFDRFVEDWTRSPVLLLGPKVDVLDEKRAVAIVQEVSNALEAASPAPQKG